MIGRSIALAGVLLGAGTAGIAQDAPAVLTDRGKYEPPPAKPTASEATLLDGRGRLETSVVQDKTEDAARSDAQKAVAPSVTAAPTLHTAPLDNDSSSALSPRQIEAVSQAREIDWRVDLVGRIDRASAARNWQQIQDGIDNAPMTKAVDLVQDLLGALAGRQSQVTTVPNNGGRVVTGRYEPIQDTPSDSQSTANDSLSIEERAILFDAKAHGYEVPAQLRSAGTTPAAGEPPSDADPFRDLRARLLSDIKVRTARLDEFVSQGLGSGPEDDFDALRRAREQSVGRRKKLEDADRGLADANRLRDESAAARRRADEDRDALTKIDLPRETLRSAVPADWVPCQCPAQHPGAGLLVEGVRWHTPALHCPQ